MRELFVADFAAHGPFVRFVAADAENAPIVPAFRRLNAYQSKRWRFLSAITHAFAALSAAASSL